jgi:hypothetical protein
MIMPRGRNEPRLISKCFHSDSRGEEGQGLLESAVAFLFLAVVLAVMFEMAVVFGSYIALLNSAVQGAIYAAGHTEMQNNPPDEAYQQYTSIVQAEVLAGGLSWIDTDLHAPELPPNIEPGAPLTVTVDYTMTTMFSEVVFPMFERFGLPSRYHISARTTVPIR